MSYLNVLTQGDRADHLLRVDNIVKSYLGDLRSLNDSQKRAFASSMLNDPDSPLANLLVNAQSRDLQKEFLNNNKRPNLTTVIALTSAMQTKLRNIFSDYELTMNTQGTPSDHPLGAAARALEGDICYWKAKSYGGTIIDIGGNYMTHLTRGHLDVHCCCLRGDERDLARYGERELKIDDFNEDVDYLIKRTQEKVLSFQRRNASLVNGSMIGKKKKNDVSQSPAVKRYETDVKFLESLELRKRAFDTFKCQFMPNDFDNREYFGSKYRCFNNAADCNVQSCVGICVEASYDIDFITMAKIMKSHGLKKIFGMMIHSPQLLRTLSGYIDSLDLFYDINIPADEITFTFKGDSSFQYVHKWSVYKQYLFSNDRIFVDGLRISYNVISERDGLIEYEFTVVENCFDYEKSFVMYDHMGSSIVGFKTYVPDYDASCFRERQFVPIDVYCPADIYDTLIKYGIRSNVDRAKIHSKVMINKSYFIINGRSIYAKEKLEHEYLEAVVSAIYLAVLEYKFYAGQFMSLMIEDNEDIRHRFDTRFLNVIYKILKSKFPTFGIDFEVVDNDNDAAREQLIKVLMGDNAKFVEVFDILSIQKYQLNTFITDINAWYIDGDINPDALLNRYVLNDDEREALIANDNFIVDDDMIEDINSFFLEDRQIETDSDDDDDNDSDSDDSGSDDGDLPTASSTTVRTPSAYNTNLFVGRVPFDNSNNVLESHYSVESQCSTVHDEITKEERKELINIRQSLLAIPDTIDKPVISHEKRKYEIMYAIDEASRYNAYITRTAIYNARLFVKRQNNMPNKVYCKQNYGEGRNFNWLRISNGKIDYSLLPSDLDYMCAYDPAIDDIVYFDYGDEKSSPFSTPDRVDTKSQWLFVYDAFRIFVGKKKSDSLQNVYNNFKDKDFLIAVYGLDEGVPGCGKTFHMVEIYEFPGLFLCASREAADDVRKRLIDKGKLTASDAKKYVRTIDSFLINPNVKADILYIDEALMTHGGDIFACGLYSGCKRVIMSGDRKQIPFINLDRSFCNNIGAISRFDFVKCFLVTVRCPQDVTWLLNKYYYHGLMRTVSKQKRSLFIKRIESYRKVPKKIKARDHAFMSFTRNDKKKLTELGCNKANTMTIHQSQGSTFDETLIMRDVKQTMRLFNVPNHVIVGISRHRKIMIYYTCTEGDLMSKLIKEAESNSHKFHEVVLENKYISSNSNDIDWKAIDEYNNNNSQRYVSLVNSEKIENHY